MKDNLHKNPINPLTLVFWAVFAIYCYPLLSSLHEILFFGLILYWVLIIRRYRVSPQVSMAISIVVFLVSLFFMMIVGAGITVERLCVWTFVFFTIGVLQAYKEQND